MMQAPTVLIVHDDRSVLARLATKLKGTVDVSTATTFDEAKAALTARPPTVLITGVRLGQYNGLHLIIRIRIDSPTTAAIVISNVPDAALEKEAATHGAMCLLYPAEEEQLVSAVKAAIERVGG